ncbi:CPBP family intramembrane metalloprotease [Aquiflexum sp. LQ15W]|uniref:CPBP family intramembrane glutamic endopeptidase n=1 Tax=Cognataquiflexum nitidum TaxID=2922272 RepID=UPI001F12D0D7|nr:CPBP family intramembrane glutamic endopeptidase [Cognataquiflexum nitidum]MCH6198823.1 CPBP family intramembrane metalloprotease [Cognataquiflexum nitidum]
MMDNPNFGFIYHGLAYSSMFLLSWWVSRKNSLKFFSENGWAKNSYLQFFLLIWGIIVWTLVPTTLSWHSYSFLVGFDKNTVSFENLLWVLGLSVLAFLVSRSQSKKLDVNSRDFHQNPSFGVILTYAVLRFIFLISYEIWFRGYFLEDLISIFPLSVAIGINVFFYALIHVLGGTREALGSIIFGVILCLMVVSFGNVWPAIIIHLSLTFGYEASFFVRKLKTGLEK